jgi:hypothetical protein
MHCIEQMEKINLRIQIWKFKLDLFERLNMIVNLVRTFWASSRITLQSSVVVQDKQVINISTLKKQKKKKQPNRVDPFTLGGTPQNRKLFIVQHTHPHSTSGATHSWIQ